MTQPSWAARLTKLTADQVRRYRKARGLSGQQLADRCAELGLDISRATITDLENGRRAAVTLAELLILAAALDIPPLQLIIPLGTEETVEILPGLTVPSWDAAKWIDGDSRPTIRAADSRPALRFDGEPTPADCYRAYEAAVKAWRAMLARMAESEAAGDHRSAQVYKDAAAESVSTIAMVRHQIYARGLLVPARPSELINLPDPAEPLDVS